MISRRHNALRTLLVAALVGALTSCSENLAERAVCEGGDGQVSIAWQTVPGVDNYRVFRANEGMTAEPIGEVDGASFLDTGVQNGTRYGYIIRSVVPEGVEALDVAACAVTPSGDDPVDVAAVADLTCRAKSGKVDLAWTPVAGAISYRVLRATPAAAYEPVGEIQAPPFVDSTVVDGTAYQFAVVAVAPDGSTAEPSIACSARPGVIGGGDPPAAVTNLACRGKRDKLDVTWTASSGAAFYRVYRSVAGIASTAGEVVNAVFADFGLPPGVEHRYLVRAVAADGTESADSTACAYTPAGGGDDNRAPQFASAPVTNALERFVYEYPVVATDPEGGPVTLSTVQAPPGMYFADDTNTLLWIPTANQVGPFTIELRATDAQGAFGTQAFVVLAVELNEPPRITSVPVPRAQVGEVYHYDVDAFDPESEALSFAFADPAPAGMTIDAATGVISWTPSAVALAQGVRVLAADAHGAFDTQSFLVDATLDPLVLTAPEGEFSVEVGQTLELRFASNYTSSLYYARPLPPNAVQDGDVFRFTPVAGQAGRYQLIFKAAFKGLYDVNKVTIQVTDSNQPPVLGALGPFQVAEGGVLRFAVNATDPDGDVITIRAPGSAIENAFFDEFSHEFVFQPSYTQAGSFEVAFQAGDGVATTDSIATIQVLEAEQPVEDLQLTVNPPQSPTFVQGQTISGSVRGELASGTAAPAALVTGLAPTNVQQGRSAQIAITGRNTEFVQGQTSASFGEGIAIDAFAVTSPTQATATISVSPTAAVGIRQMRVQQAGQEIPSVVAFRVEQGAAIVRGRLVDSFTGEALVGVRVTVNGSNASALTGADGSFEIEGVPGGEQTLVAVAPNFDVLEMAITVEENSTYALDQPIGLEALARPARPGGSLPRAQTLASVLDRGVSIIDQSISKEQAKLLISDTMIAVGLDQLGVLDENGRQMNPQFVGPGMFSLTPKSVDYFANRMTLGEAVTLREISFALQGSFGWVFDGLDVDSLVFELQSSVNDAWKNLSNPDYALVVVLFNPGGTTLSTEPPVITRDTRFNSFQTMLLVTSFVVRHVGILDMALDKKLEARGIDPRTVIEGAGFDPEIYALAPHERPGGGGVTLLARHAAEWAGFAGDLAFGAPAQAQVIPEPIRRIGGAGLRGVQNVFTGKTATAAFINGGIGVLFSLGIVMLLAFFGFAAPLAAFSILGTFIAGFAATVIGKFIGGVLEDPQLAQNVAPKAPVVISQTDPTIESPNFYLRFRRSESDLEADRERRLHPDLSIADEFEGWVKEGWRYQNSTIDKRLLEHRYLLWKYNCNPDSPDCRREQSSYEPLARDSFLAPLTNHEIDAEPLLPNGGIADPKKAHGGEFEQFRVLKTRLNDGTNYFKIQTVQFYRRLWTGINPDDETISIPLKDVGVPDPPAWRSGAPSTANGLVESFRGNALQELGKLSFDTTAEFLSDKAAGRLAQSEQQLLLRRQVVAEARANRIAETLAGEKHAEIGAQKIERDAAQILDGLKTKIEPVKAQIASHLDLGAAAINKVAEPGISDRTVQEVLDELLDPNTPSGQSLNSRLDAAPTGSRNAYRRFVTAQIGEHRLNAGVTRHNDAIARLRNARTQLNTALQLTLDMSSVGHPPLPQVSDLPGAISVDGATIGRRAPPRPFTIPPIEIAADIPVAVAAIDRELAFHQGQVNRLTGVLADPAHPFVVDSNIRSREFQRTFYDAELWRTDVEALEIAEARFANAEEVVQLQREAASAQSRAELAQAKGVVGDLAAPRGLKGIQQGLASRQLLTHVNSGWGGVKANISPLDVGNVVGVGFEVASEIHALRDDIDVLSSDLSRTIVVTAQTLPPDPATGRIRIQVTSTPAVADSRPIAAPFSVASRFGETPEPRLPSYAQGIARGMLATMFRAPYAMDDAGNSLFGPKSAARRSVRRVQFTGPGGLAIQFESDPDLAIPLGVLYPAGPPPDNPRDGFLFRDFPFSPPEPERYSAGFPSELIAVDSKGRAYLENYNSNESFGGRIFRFAGVPMQREHVGSVNYFSQTLMSANPAFPIAMEVGDARSASGATVEDLFVVNRDLGVYYDANRQPVHRVLRLPIHQLDELPFYANGQNRHRMVGQPWAEHPDFRFDGPTDLEADARDPGIFAARERPLYMSDYASLYALRDVNHDSTAEVTKIADVPGRVFSGIASDQNGHLYVADFSAGELYLIPQQLLDDIVNGNQAPLTSDADLDNRAFLIKVNLHQPGDVELDTFEHRYIVSTPEGLVPFDIPAVGRLPGDIAEMRVDALGSEVPVQFRVDRGHIFEIGSNSEGTFAGKVIRVRVRRVDGMTGQSTWTSNMIRTQLFGATLLRDDALNPQ